MYNHLKFEKDNHRLFLPTYFVSLSQGQRTRVLVLQGITYALKFPLYIHRKSPRRLLLTVGLVFIWRDFQMTRDVGAGKASHFIPLSKASPVRDSPEVFPHELGGKFHLASSLHPSSLMD